MHVSFAKFLSKHFLEYLSRRDSKFKSSGIIFILNLLLLFPPFTSETSSYLILIVYFPMPCEQILCVLKQQLFLLVT